MATLTVWKFDEAAGADEALAKLEYLDAQEVIEIEDAAVVRWPTEAPTAETAAHASDGKMDGLVKRFKRSGIEDSSVQSSRTRSRRDVAVSSSASMRCSTGWRTHSARRRWS